MHTNAYSKLFLMQKSAIRANMVNIIVLDVLQIGVRSLQQWHEVTWNICTIWLRTTGINFQLSNKLLHTRFQRFSIILWHLYVFFNVAKTLFRTLSDMESEKYLSKTTNDNWNGFAYSSLNMQVHIWYLLTINNIHKASKFRHTKCIYFNICIVSKLKPLHIRSV